MYMTLWLTDAAVCLHIQHTEGPFPIGRPGTVLQLSRLRHEQVGFVGPYQSVHTFSIDHIQILRVLWAGIL